MNTQVKRIIIEKLTEICIAEYNKNKDKLNIAILKKKTDCISPKKNKMIH